MAVTKKFIAPALPLPRSEYDAIQQMDINRALRLYFTLLDDYFLKVVLDAFNGGAGGNGITFPHIAASDSTDQFATADNTPTVVNWDTLDAGYLWDLNAPGSAVAKVAGVYKITYSLQFANTDNAQHTVECWLERNGTPVDNSTTSFSVIQRKNPSTPGFTCAYSEATFPMAVGDEIELYWATDKAFLTSPATAGVFMFHDPAQTTPYVRPAIPSAIGSITYVSALPPA